MDRLIFVEVLDRRGRVVQRARLDALPATVGRGYRNTVILDDRYVSPEHVRIALADDGSLVVEDVGSANGLFLEPGPERVARAAVRPGAVFRVGHTLLRVATAEQDVAPAALDPAAAVPGRRRTSRRALALALAAALGLSMLLSYLGTYGETSAAALIADALTLGAGLVSWSGAWALVTRVTAQRFGFGQHLAVVAGVFLAVEVAQLVLQLGDLIESGTALYSATQTLLLVLALASALYGHLRIAAALSPGRRLAWALGVAAAFVGLDEFTDFAQGRRFDRSPTFAGAVRPVAGARAMSLDAFIAGAAELQRSVDAQADESAR